MVGPVNWVLAVLLGVLGAALHDAYELSEVVRSRRKDVPDEWKTGPFIAATAIRIGAGGALAGVLGAFGEVGPIGALLVGVVGALAVQRMAAARDMGSGRS